MKKVLSVFILLFLFNTIAYAGNTAEPINIGEKLSLHSKLLNEDRDYWVYLPESYSEDKRYPVVYLLDGNFHFHAVTGTYKHMTAQGLVPDVIVVALLNTDRTRDLTPSHITIGADGKPSEHMKTSGGGANFLKFIKTELMVKINSDYKTQPHNTLIGHSFGGLFALYALLEEPTLFQSYISIDPSIWWDDAWLLKELDKQIEQPPQTYTSVYIAAANNPDMDGFPPKLMIGPQREFFEKMTQWQSDDFDATLDYFIDEDHGTVPFIALYKGLSFLYGDYRLSVDTAMENPSLLKSHHEDWSKKMGYTLAPGENIINRLGYAFLWKKKTKEAINYFKQNTKNYPNSFNTYDSLAEAYMEDGQTELAISNYEKVLTFDENNEHAKSQLEKLRAPK